jgi:hypothetical protein
MKPSKQNFGTLIAFVSVLLLCVPGLVRGGAALGAKRSDIPVICTLQVSGDLAQSTNYSIEGDAWGSYHDGINSVSSILQDGTCCSYSGDWILDMTSSLSRTILIDLRQPVPNSGAQPIFAYQYVPARIIVKAHEAQAGSFPLMRLNQTLSCPAFVRFTYAGTSYRLIMSSGPNAFPDYAETNNTQVTCTAVNSSTNQCVAWTILPVIQAGGTVRNIARLEKLPNKGSAVNLGDFYTTFLINLTNP